MNLRRISAPIFGAAVSPSRSHTSTSKSRPRASLTKYRTPLAVRLCSCSVPRHSFSPSRLGAGVAPLHALFFSLTRVLSAERGKKGRGGFTVSLSHFDLKILALVLRSPSTARALLFKLSSLPRFHFYLETSFAPVRRKGLTPPPLEGSADSRYKLCFGKKKRPTF